MLLIGLWVYPNVRSVVMNPLSNIRGGALPRRRCFHRKPGPFLLSKRRRPGLLHVTRALMASRKEASDFRRRTFNRGIPAHIGSLLSCIQWVSSKSFIFEVTGMPFDVGETSPTARLDPTISCLDDGEPSLGARDDAQAPPIYPLSSLKQPTEARHSSPYAPSAYSPSLLHLPGDAHVHPSHVVSFYSIRWTPKCSR